MDEREFVAKRRAAWERLGAIVAKANGPSGIRALGRDELRALGPLYRRASSDLAYARARAVSPALVGQINQLVGRAYALLYRTDRRSWGGLARFLTYDFPAAFRRRLPFFLAACAFLLLGTVVGYVLVIRNKQNIDLFIPPGSMLRDSVSVWETGKTADRIDDTHAVRTASFLMQNNIRVSFVAFALGIAGGFFTAYLLFINGGVLGGLAAYVTHAHQNHNLWPAILPHGVVELSETCIAAAAGLSLGWAVLAPGIYSRRDALVLAARDSVKLVMGGAILLVFAGFVEAFVSHSLLPKPLKIAFGIASGVALYLYLFRAGTSESSPEEVTTASAP